MFSQNWYHHPFRFLRLHRSLGPPSQGGGRWDRDIHQERQDRSRPIPRRAGGLPAAATGRWRGRWEDRGGGLKNRETHFNQSREISNIRYRCTYV